MNSVFVHLRVHSEYSLADGIVRIPELIAGARAQGLPAVALTDRANLFGAVKFYREAVAAGVKPLIGADVWLENPEDAHKPYLLSLLCQNLDGYHHLCRLLTRAYTEGQHSGRPCIARRWLDDSTTGLIALSGAQEGDIGQALLAANTTHAEELLASYQALFPGRFYLELQRTGQPLQEEYNHAAVVLAARRGAPVVATNPVLFLRPADFEAHEVRVCIQDGRVLTDARRPKRHTPQQYFRSGAEMAALFEDIPEALENTRAIARRCNLRLEFGRYFLPDYPVPAGVTIDELLRRQAAEGLERRLLVVPEIERAARRAVYRQRLEHELAVIIKMGFAGYFLIVADFIQWAKNHDIPVGPGRGSGAGSLVAYCLGITELDPIKYDLLFERFLNPERVSLPDFDVDFCMERRDEVIEYVIRRYGQDRVAQIITHGTMAAKAVVRDVGRVMNHPYGYVDKLAKLIPFELGMTLTRALEIEPMLRERYEQEEDVRALFDTARALEGLARNAGKHAGGVVIAPTALTDFMPLYCEQGSTQTVTQFDMEDLEKLGLVKFDFLGLRTLTVIDKAVKIINAERRRTGEPPLAIELIPIDDPATFALLKTCRTTALFQLESRGMKDLIQRLQPDKFEEIVALVALFRPGPLQSGMVDDFINRKHGRSPSKYLHPSIESILKPTYGVILYQEQVMQIAQVLAGYSLGSADLLRRAMGKKKPEEMALQREGFVRGARAHGVSESLATHIFDMIEKFAGYGFNRSHSAAYALIAYQTAWLKAHHPAAFMAAVLSADMDKTDKVVTMIAECRDMRLAILPPDINRCDYEFVPVDDAAPGGARATGAAEPEAAKVILYGLGAIKGLGQAAIEAILQARREAGPFRDLFDFCRRIDARKVNRRVLESLIKAGALDNLGAHRATLMASLGAALAAAERHTRDTAAGQVDLFGATERLAEAQVYTEAPLWSEEQRLEGEKETLGLYLTGHPIARHAEELARITDATIAELKPTQNRTVVVAGLVVALRAMQTRRGDRMAFVTLDDRTGRLELAVFSDLFASSRELLVKDNLLVVEGQVSVDDYTGGFKMAAEKVYNMEQARAAFSTRLVIDVSAEQTGNGFVDELKRILAPAARGSCPVYLHYVNGDAEAEIALGEEWKISPSHALLEHLSRLAGERNVHLVYR
ncbi:MAG: DNA polymerase III subunit alpha [Candidatus Muproteobacteria bacterium RIFCSPHIGHO2_02_FULL_65_16]|uniref:DNA polymerase III subunit alpha n=1 Tax=Candidatus Muproteobacteria bacterium RIFCSPHIGHO2_02_FULL_65_16 TaxID=1817766 RepID=A0A1F6U531_9PROT|nr:MAG: DNA polymerase III subunit alpha [Candidatus Muproteobacteria bacterium RIFCSPHIGHO2_02_FULL_65_16]